MFTKYLASPAISVLLIVIFLLIGVLPVQAESPVSLLSASGDFLWAKSMGGMGYDFGEDIAIDTEGNVYTTGTFEGTVDFDPGSGTYELISATTDDIFVSKFDINGDFVWAKSMGVSGRYTDSGISIDASGSVYITGSFEDSADFDPGAGSYILTSAGDNDIFISKLDTNGNFVWAKSMGGASSEAVNGIIIDSSDSIYTTGTFGDTADFDPGVGTANLTGGGIFISKLDNNGSFVWAKSFGGTSGGGRSTDIAVDSNSNIYTTGTFEGTVDFDPGTGIVELTSEGGLNIFVSKLDISGSFVWAKSMGQTSWGGSQSEGIAVDSDGDVYTTGEFMGTADFDPGMGTFNLTCIFYYDIFVSKLDSSGDFVWAKSMGGMDFDYGRDISLDSSGNVYTMGSFERGYTVPASDFDPGPGTYSLISAGYFDIFVSKLDSSGDFVWAKRMGGTSSDGGAGIAMDSRGNVYTTGYFQGTADFDPGIGTYFLISAGSVDIFISKLENGDVAPTVLSIVRTDASPTSTTYVHFTVTFSESIAGVDKEDFDLTTTGISGATVNGVSGSETTYTVTVYTGSGNGTIRLDLVNDGTIMDMTFNPLKRVFTNGETYIIVKSATFGDALLNYWANNYIERLYNAGITSGCSIGIYCPDDTITRAQMAVFLLKGMYGSSYTPPAVEANTGFGDVATNYWAAAWIKQLAVEGITAGCGSGNYCPDATVTRAQMATILLKAKHGSAYSPPSATGVFTDVPVGYWADKWIEQLAVEGITGGCGMGVYCPDSSVTRAQMAVFLVKAFSLP